MEFNYHLEGGDSNGEAYERRGESPSANTSFETTHPDYTGLVVSSESALHHTVTPMPFEDGGTESLFVADDTLLVRALEAESPEDAQATQTALAPAGLEVRVHAKQRALVVTDPVAFTAALQDVDPESGTAYTLRPNASHIMAHALQRASTVSGDPADDAFVTAITAVSPELVGQFERLGIPDDTTLPMRELALAHEQGSTKEWQALYRAHALGQYGSRLDVRVPLPRDWDGLAPHLARLHEASPGGAFTQHVRSRLISELSAARAALQEEVTRADVVHLTSAQLAPDVYGVPRVNYVHRVRLMQYGLDLIERLMPAPGPGA